MDQTNRDLRKRQNKRILDAFRLRPYQREFEENSRDRQREFIESRNRREKYCERLNAFAKRAGEECERLIDAGEKCQNYVNNSNQARKILFGNYDVPQLDQLCSHLKSFNETIQQYQRMLDTGEMDKMNKKELRMVKKRIDKNWRELIFRQEKFRTEGLRPPFFDLSWVDANGQLAVGGAIRCVEALVLAGVKCVVDFCENKPGDAADDPEIMKKYDIDYLPLPTKDGTAPTDGDIDKSVEWIIERLKQGKDVLVHCREGKGRSLMIGWCLLIALGEGDATSTMNLVTERRFPNSQYSFFTGVQIFPVMRFEKRYQQKQSSKQ